MFVRVSDFVIFDYLDCNLIYFKICQFQIRVQNQTHGDSNFVESTTFSDNIGNTGVFVNSTQF